MKTVFLARHAKSNWNQAGISDFERPLNERGFSDAPKMAAYLSRQKYSPQLIISSDAKRAMQTAAEYKNYLTPDTEVSLAHKLYLASRDDIVELIQHTDNGISSLMLVGHNPGMSEVVDYFLPKNIDDMPTCSIAIIEFDTGQWLDVKAQSGRLFSFEYPGKLNL